MLNKGFTNRNNIILIRQPSTFSLYAFLLLFETEDPVFDAAVLVFFRHKN